MSKLNLPFTTRDLFPNQISQLSTTKSSARKYPQQLCNTTHKKSDSRHTSHFFYKTNYHLLFTVEIKQFCNRYAKPLKMTFLQSGVLFESLNRRWFSSGRSGTRTWSVNSRTRKLMDWQYVRLATGSNRRLLLWKRQRSEEAKIIK